MKSLHALYRNFLFGFRLFIDDPAAGGGAAAGAAAGGAGAAGAAAGGAGAAGAGAGAAGGAGAGAGAAGGTPGPFIDPTTGKFGAGFVAKYPALAKKFTEPDALAGSYANLETLINAKGIIKPGPNATPQQINDYFTQLGRPATAADYKLAAPEKLTIDGKEVAVPKELWEAETASKASELFHKLGLSTEQAAELTKFDLERGVRAMGTLQAQMTKSREDCMTALKAEWPGANFDRNLQAAKDAAAKVGLTRDILNANPHLANDPLFIQAMHKVSTMTAETPSAGARGGQHGTMNAAQEIAAIYADKTHAWHPENASKNPAAHKAAVEHMSYLYKVKTGEI